MFYLIFVARCICRLVLKKRNNINHLYETSTNKYLIFYTSFGGWSPLPADSSPSSLLFMFVLDY